MKKIGFFVVMTAVFAVIGGCQRDELTDRQLTDEGVQSQFKVSDPLFEGLNEIAFSVEDNRLVFENEEEFQKGIDFLANLGDENFPAFEEAIGFDSYRKVYEEDTLMSQLFVDELYQTMLNPEMEIIIGDYLFKEDPQNKTTFAYQLNYEDICYLKSAKVSPTHIFSWYDEAFNILEGIEANPILKSGCRGNHDHKKEWVIQSGTYPAPLPNAAYAYRAEVKAKLCYQTTAIFKSIISKIKTESFVHEGLIINGQLFAIKMSQDIDFHYDRHNEDPVKDQWSQYKITNASQNEIAWRPFYGTKRVNCYNVHSTFKWEVWSNWVAPQFLGQYSTILFIEACNAGSCPL